MLYTPLHLKYRPQTFAELIGQEAIAQTLTNAIRLQRIAPAYLFCGSRGTGKTSSARILAKSLNCHNSDSPTPNPCGSCHTCRAIALGSSLDVIEIDAASNSGVENIRDLIERVQFVPMECRYKVYVIDEAHGLSKNAMEALLKTLEEPPLRVVFVLATTEPHKLPDTIRSRCQRHDFRRIPNETMVQHLTNIASKESIDITTDGLRVVALFATGGLRDALTLLDQLSLLEPPVTAPKVEHLVGAVSEQDLLLLVEAIADFKPEPTLAIVRSIISRGKEPLVILQSLVSFLTNLAIVKSNPNNTELLGVDDDIKPSLLLLAKKLEINAIFRLVEHLRLSEVQVKLSTQSFLWLEAAVLGLFTKITNPSPAPLFRGILPIQMTTHEQSFVWKDWKTPADAIAWAASVLPHIPTSQLEAEFTALPTVNGKKAPAWVDYITATLTTR